VNAVRAVIGLRSHSGWAAAVTVGGPARSPIVFDRRRLETADPKAPGSKQPFHAAESLPWPKADALIDRCVASSRGLARKALDALIDDLERQGRAAGGIAILLASGRPLPDRQRILSSHALIHAAEGELFRDVLRRAAVERGLTVSEIVERDVDGRVEGALGISTAQWRSVLAAMGKSVGSPWRQDEKLAATAAWIALAGSGGDRRRPVGSTSGARKPNRGSPD